MSNSPLVDLVRISPNKNSPRNHVIDTITIHCTDGQISCEALGELFANPARQCSSQYGIGPDGRVILMCDEGDRSWCSSSPANDHRAITIEVASDKGEPCNVNPAAYEKLILLVADICKRNGIKKLLWKADKSLIGQVDKQNMTVHRWFDKMRSCPGEFLYSRHSEIAARVNAILGADSGEDPTDEQPAENPPVAPQEPAEPELYRVGLGIDFKVQGQIGAYRIKDNALKSCPKGYKVFDSKGQVVYENTGDIALTADEVEDLARRVIRGEFGNGEARKIALGDKYAVVQRRVDQIMKGE